ncbi:MAG: hypothetical protein ABR573_00505 [Candidatus Dormibacteria bacterium]
MNLAVMLSSDRPRAVEEATALCLAAVRAGNRASLFLLGDGTTHAERASAVARQGVRVSLCEADAAVRGIHKSGQPGVFFGSLYDWATLVEDADHVLSLC